MKEAKEIALRLIHRFAPYSEDNASLLVSEMMLAKCCALICVDEILNEVGETNYFWNVVKQEIEKL